MCRQVFLIGLAMAIMFTGCLLRKDQPVAEQKSIGRVLDEAFKGRKGLQSQEAYISAVRPNLQRGLTEGFDRNKLDSLGTVIIRGGSQGIVAFKTALISKIFDEFAVTSDMIAKRITSYYDLLSPSVRTEVDVKLFGADLNYLEAVALLKKHTGIADDKVFARLVKKQGEHLDELAEGVATNHRVADALGAEIASRPDHFALKMSGVSVEEFTSELKVSSDDFFLKEIMFNTPDKSNPLAGYKFVQELSGVDIGDEAAVLELLLRRGDDGKFAYQKLSAEEIKALGNPFDKHFTKPILADDPKLAADDYLLQLFKAN